MRSKRKEDKLTQPLIVTQQLAAREGSMLLKQNNTQNVAEQSFTPANAMETVEERQGFPR